MNYMKCPHCLVEFHDDPLFARIGVDVEGEWSYENRQCPACQKFIISLTCGKDLSLYGRNKGNYGLSGRDYGEITKQWRVYPKGSARPPCPIEVPPNIAIDYSEACIVLPDSPKASAALSRRCLQNLLREKGGVKPSDLSNEIQQIINNNTLPGYLMDNIDAVRVIGNFAAHPNKSNTTGIIIDVESGEAEWSLDVLESLFDFYYVHPSTAQNKKKALNEKLSSMGKTPIK
jgi:hypothetical protein